MMRCFPAGCCLIACALAMSGAQEPAAAQPPPDKAAPATAPAALERLVEQLAGRRRGMQQGTIRYDFYQFRGDLTLYERVAALAGTEAANRAEAQAALSRLAHEAGAIRVTASRGEIYFKGLRARLVEQRVEEYAREAERIRTQAQASGARAILPANHIETAADRGCGLIARLTDGEKLSLRPYTVAELPLLWEIDVTFADWRAAVDAGPAPGQTISAFSRDGLEVIRYADAPARQRNGRSGYGDYEFDPRRGYAPVRIRLGEAATGRPLEMEILYGYERRPPPGPWRAYVTIRAQPAREKEIGVEMWLISEWSDQVAEEDLLIPVPANRIVVDQRGERDRFRTLPAGLGPSLDAASLAAALGDWNSDP